ncbi:hypothetical protein KIN20_035105 [Parelaphostrongylus tenuis]|uniref:Uncharacterized protein n=1 Tax=Parelaphostrongylus tenuis TaxID=148309 RepID=A0AAD5RAM2_PARTN|nr:hypothetical protein KIN20_035105 [Parelaphostrongylus tenuis]
MSRNFFWFNQCSSDLKKWKSDGDRRLANTADDPSAPSPNRSSSSVFSWQRVALHVLKQNDLATGGNVERCLIATVPLADNNCLQRDGLTACNKSNDSAYLGSRERPTLLLASKRFGFGVGVPC